MIKLVEHDRCTGCGACAFVCPKQCIKMGEDSIGRILPIVDNEKCVECKRCVKTCPILSPVDYREPMKAYAAWSSDEEERRTSASGGIAAEIYKNALAEGYNIAGAVQQNDFSVKLELSEDCDDIRKFKNSKYVFSSAIDLYGQLKETIKKDNKCVVVGLPCQIAAIRKIFKDNENIVLIDVVCHGTTPTSYLKQHIKTIERLTDNHTVRMSFRDPDTYTYTFTYTLYDANNVRFYARRTKDGDSYQFGYHRAISYRENCYHCPFACGKRISDITLSDYEGLGKLAPCAFENLKVSSILVNTEIGNSIVNNLLKNKQIVAEERPTQEPIQGNQQLQHPSVKSKYRHIFERTIVQTNGDFEKAIISPMQMYGLDEKLLQMKKVLKRIKKKFF